MKMLRGILLFGTLVFVLAFVNWNIYQTEQDLTQGEVIYFDLAPLDPRSLIQGDYMVLFYRIEDEAAADIPDSIEEGQIVARLDEDHVARYERLYEGGELAENERLIRFDTDVDGLNIGVESFFFQEGLGNTYANARYAEIRLTDGGGVLLVELVNDGFKPLVD